MADRRNFRRIETEDGVDLSYRDWGTGRPVVFTHGWAVNRDIWQYQFRDLSSHGARCIAYDKRGHGRSGDAGAGFSYNRFADDLATVLDSLDLTDTTLVGHSMGSGEIVRYLSRHGPERVSRIVLVSSALPYMMKTSDNPTGIDASAFEKRRNEWTPDFPKWLAANSRAFLGGAGSEETVRWISAMGLQASFNALFETSRAIAETDLRVDVAAVSVPTLVIHGNKDKSAPVDLTAKRLAELIPECRIELYEGAPHGLLISHSARLSADISAWMV